GGFGSIPGALAGGVTICLVEMFSGGYLPLGVKGVAASVVVLSGLVIRPHGMFGVLGGKRAWPARGSFSRPRNTTVSGSSKKRRAQLVCCPRIWAVGHSTCAACLSQRSQSDADFRALWRVAYGPGRLHWSSEPRPRCISWYWRLCTRLFFTGYGSALGRL